MDGFTLRADFFLERHQAPIDCFYATTGVSNPDAVLHCCLKRATCICCGKTAEEHVNLVKCVYASTEFTLNIFPKRHPQRIKAFRDLLEAANAARAANALLAKR